VINDNQSALAIFKTETRKPELIMLKCLKKRKNVVNNTALHLLADDDETAAVGSCRNME